MSDRITVITRDETGQAFAVDSVRWWPANQPSQITRLPPQPTAGNRWQIELAGPAVSSSSLVIEAHGSRPSEQYPGCWDLYSGRKEIINPISQQRPPVEVVIVLSYRNSACD